MRLVLKTGKGYVPVVLKTRAQGPSSVGSTEDVDARVPSRVSNRFDMATATKTTTGSGGGSARVRSDGRRIVRYDDDDDDDDGTSDRIDRMRFESWTTRGTFLRGL